MTFVFCLKAIIAQVALLLAFYVVGKFVCYPIIVFYRWAKREDDVFYLHKHDEDVDEKDS